MGKTKEVSLYEFFKLEKLDADQILGEMEFHACRLAKDEACSPNLERSLSVS